MIKIFISQWLDRGGSSIADKSRNRSIAEGRGFGKGGGIDINSKARQEVNKWIGRMRIGHPYGGGMWV